MQNIYDTTSDLTSLISARICHDLASPLGAIANGMELLELSGSLDSPESVLINDSITSATARIDFFRIAYGIAQQNMQLSPAEAHKRLHNVFSEKKMTIEWGILTDIPYPQAKLLFLLLQAMERALPQGRNVTLRETDTGWEINANGPTIRIEPELWTPLSNDGVFSTLHSSQIQFALAYMQLQILERSIDINTDATNLNLIVRHSGTSEVRNLRILAS